MHKSIERITAWLLRCIDPRAYHHPALFHALTRLTTTISCDVVCLRRRTPDAAAEVFLTERTASSYIGQWHCPGGILRPYEVPEDVIARVVREEYRAILKGTPRFAGQYFQREERGYFLMQVYVADLEGELSSGRFFSVEQLPENLVPHQRICTIPMTLAVH